MCPARIKYSNGYNFILKKGEELNKQSVHFHELQFEEKIDVNGWVSIHGTKKGYKVTIWGRHDKFYFITPSSVTSSPAGHEKDILLEEGNIYTLSGGTRITPIDKEKRK